VKLKRTSLLRVLWAFLAFLALWLSIKFAPADMNQAQRTCLGIFILAAVFWITEAIPLFVTSFLLLALQSILLAPHIDGSYRVFLAPFFSSTILLFLGGFVLARGLARYHLDERMAYYLLDKVGDSPGRVLFGMMAVTAFLSMWMSNTATTALMIAVAYPLVRQMEPEDPFSKALILGIPFSANVGGIGTPIGTPPNAIALSALKEVGVNLSFLKWMVLTVPLEVFILLVIYWVLTMFFRPRASKLKLSLEKMPPPEKREYFVSGVLVLTVLLWLTTGLHGIPSSVVSTFPILALFGTGLLKREDFNSLGWDVLFVIGGGLSLGVGVHRSGLDRWLLASLGFEKLGFYLLLFIFAFLAALLTNFMSNTSTAALLVPLVIALGKNPLVLSLGIALSASASMLLPISTPPNAIAYGSGMIRVKDMAKSGAVITFIFVIAISTIGYFYWKLLGF